MNKCLADIKVAIVDDYPAVAKTIAAYVRKIGCHSKVFTDPCKLAAKLQPDEYDIVISDIRMPGMDGIKLLREIRKRSPNTDVIMVSAHADKNDAICALREGAYDFFEKPVEFNELRVTMERTVAFRRVVQERDELAKDLSETIKRDDKLWGMNAMVGNSRAVRSVLSLIRRAQKVAAPVLVTGESGTGKELVARMLHHGSERAKGPFIPLNCAAMPADLAESQLFGHAKGAFTGASDAQEGAFESADGGTLFLDEIGDMPIQLQPKLLRVLEDGIVTPVGKTSGVTVDVRVIAATNSDLHEKISSKDFRKDLFYRLNTITIELTPLRKRPEDIPLLIYCFLESTSAQMARTMPSVPDEVIEKLKTRPWQGNVRELKNAVERALIVNAGDTLVISDFGSELLLSEPEGSSAVKDEKDSILDVPNENILSLEELEQCAVRKAMQKTSGNVSKAAEILGISRNKLYRILPDA